MVQIVLCLKHRFISWSYFVKRPAPLKQTFVDSLRPGPTFAGVFYHSGRCLPEVTKSPCDRVILYRVLSLGPNSTGACNQSRRGLTLSIWWYSNLTCVFHHSSMVSLDSWSIIRLFQRNSAMYLELYRTSFIVFIIERCKPFKAGSLLQRLCQIDNSITFISCQT